MYLLKNAKKKYKSNKRRLKSRLKKIKSFQEIHSNRGSLANGFTDLSTFNAILKFCLLVITLTGEGPNDLKPAKKYI